MGQLKFNMSEDNNVDMYRNNLPNADTPPAELHCWKVKWKHRGKVTLPFTVHETLKMSTAMLLVNVFRCTYRTHLTNTDSKSLAFLNIHYNARHDLDFMVDSYAFLTTMNSFSHLIT
uniref:Uncharacterized protein n=1 Tax=Oncorhynchus tshawytscha TaxID=74940 RepID=A0A8C8IXG1_ONCTS